MWLVLCDNHDSSARWAHAALRARGLQPVELITADELALAEFQEHRLDSRGATLRFRTESGLQVDGRRLGGVLNRLYTVPIRHWRQASEQDQQYVQQEMVAFFLSWLHALPCPVINRPTPQGLCGQWRQESEWAWMARQAGLPVATYRQSSRDEIDESRGQRRLLPAGMLPTTAIVLEDRVHGPALPPALAEGCVRLARAAGTAMLGVELLRHPVDGWRFVGAHPTPELSGGGTALVDHLFGTLTRLKEAA